MATTHRSTERAIGVPGIALMVLGAAALLLSFTALEWYAGASGPDSRGAGVKFHDLHAISKLPGAAAVAGAYFGWLAWVLLILLIVVGLAANLPSPASRGLRVTGLLTGLAGAAATYLALDRLLSPSAGGSVFDHASIGLWLALAGFLVAGTGAAIGPLRAR